jgi:NADH-quinone oxidoreductase subunit A
VLENYFAILVFIAIGFAIGIALPILSWFISPKAPNAAKLATYECGFDPIGSARLPFDVRFYLVAILFILFDLETAFLVPWAVVFRQLGMWAVITIAVFLGLLVVGFIYEWKKGGLEWE